MEQYKRVAVLLGVDCLVKHRHGPAGEHDVDWRVNPRKNYCTYAGCYERICDQCAARITWRGKEGPWTMYCQKHA